MSQLMAAIDLGTNTARLLIGAVGNGGEITPVSLLRRITRLGGSFTKSQGISDEARDRSLQALLEFAAEINRYGVTKVKAVATSAVRDACNGAKFCQRVLTETGISLEIIDGKVEGLLTLRGVLAGLNEKPDKLLIFDVGGGSTEYTLTECNRVLFTESMPLGVVRLTEGKVSLSAMEDKVIRELSTLKRHLESADLLPSLKGATLVGTAGTATTLAAISMKMSNYDYRLVNNHLLSFDEIKEIFARLTPLTPAQRLQVPGLEKGREDLIVAGMLITLLTMETLGFSTLKVSDFGLLEGLLLSCYDNCYAGAGLPCVE